MSKEAGMLDINKCILSKLWYTSFIIYQESNNKPYSECAKDAVDFIKPETAIINLIHSQSDSQHQWIINILLHKLINKVTLDSEYIRKQKNYIQMKHALHLCKNFTTHLEQNLLAIYENNSAEMTAKIFEKISTDSIVFLKQNLYSDPFLTCWILNELLLIFCNVSTDIVCNLQDIYLSLLKELLEHRLSVETLHNHNSLECILCVISRMNINKSHSAISLKWLFSMLLKTCDSEDIQLAIYARTDEQLFKKWSTFFNEINIHSKLVINSNDALKIQDVLLYVTPTSTCIMNKNKLIQRVTNNKLHWITDILDICQILIINGRYNNVSRMFSCELLKGFWPVLLFKVLNKYSQEEICLSNNLKDYTSICNSLEFLISKCNFDTLYDSTLNELQVILRKNIKVLKYILNHINESARINDANQGKELANSIEIQPKISIKQIFDLQYLNSLLTLKMATNIREEEYNKIHNLLEELLESEDIFNAYCGITSAMKAILLRDVYDTKQSIITSYFTDMKNYILKLCPLDLRLQVIENIFSLLFLRQEDFRIQKSDVNNSPEQRRYENKQMKQHTMGFICNKYLVKDIVFHLKDIMVTTENEYMNMKGIYKLTEEINKTQKRISYINGAIADAIWKLELYTNLEITENTSNRDASKSLCKLKLRVFLDGKFSSNRSKENVFFYQDSNISDETMMRSSSSPESEPSHNNTKCRKRSKNIVLTTNGTVSRGPICTPLFINLMLATTESLIIRCLWMCNYTKAEEIMEVSDVRNAQLKGEVQFSQALHSFRENMCKEGITIQNKEHTSENLQFSTLENIRFAAQEGIRSSRQTSQFETFLASQETNLRMLTMEILSSNEILAICALDLALTMHQSLPISYNLCEVALKHLESCKTFDNTEHSHFFHKFYQLLYEKRNEFSIENILCDAKIPSSLKECKESEDFWNGIMIKYHEFKESQVDKNTINKILKDSNYLPGLKVLNKMIPVCCATKRYMQNICSHLQLLHTIIPTEQAILTVSDLLKIPLHYYVGYQIFELKVEPNKLEAIAHDLHINLAYSILINACPRFFYEKNIIYTPSNPENGCIVLNKASCKSDLSYRIQGPNQCVSEILTEVLKVLQNLSLNQSQLSHEDCKTISRHPELQNVLNKTSRLVSLDLSELSVGDETLTFLLNTWNLMFLHATLSVWINQPPFNNLQHAVSLMSIGYLIGDLGLVTLASLRTKLLNDIMLCDKYFMQIEELNEPAWQDLDIPHDPRVIFVMGNEYFGSPYIRVCDTQTLEEDLTIAFYEYVDYYSLRSEKCKQNIKEQEIILLPEIAERYETFICGNSEAGFNDIKESKNLVSINEYFNSSKECSVQYMMPSYLYSIILRYQHPPNTIYHKEVQPTTRWETHSIRSSLLQYLEGQCWIVSYLLQRIHNESPTILENNCDSLKRTACLENLLISPWVNDLMVLFENNQTLAGISETIPIQLLWSHFELVLQDNKWNACLDLINVLPNRLALSTELQCLKDKVLSHIVSLDDSTLNTEILKYLYQIKDIYILSQTVLHNINKWHINVCENALLYTVHHADNYKLPVHCKLQLSEILHRVLVFHKMMPYCVIQSNCTWYDIAYCTKKIDPLQIIKSLNSAEKFDLCLEWMECQAFALEIYPPVTQEFLIGLLKSESQNYKQTLKFFQALPLEESIKLCTVVLKKLESIDSLRFICDYLIQYCKATETIKYRRTLLGIDILSMLDAQERPLYIHLIKDPLLMLEQLLMNCKFESIQKILRNIQGKLNHADISRSSFDTIIRFYAKKSLDCRVSLQCDNIESKSRNMQSLISEENAEFVMPTAVPTKEEWVPNDKARKCSCCKNVIFSMFNRRHHCRRCGRVICATCSQHRMQVSGYPPSVLVRVCDDCKRQTVLQMQVLQGTPSTASSEIFDYWRLTRDQKHNETIREEFSFEYAPNISLCLAILNLHSEYKTYTSFLLDCCDEMKQLLQPVSGGKVNPEVDHTVIIRMIRSLLIAAKVKCAKLGLNTGLAHCDRFLSQVDLIASLAQSDCLHLVPSDNLDEHTLRKLRDILIEKEQWTLALDVSTKAGLDTQGVWATWGKACLKMEYFDQAREKFIHCLDKVQYENFEDWVILPHLRDDSDNSKKKDMQKLANEMASGDDTKADELSSKRAEFSKCRPLKDPPLLTEILQILDNIRVYKQYVQCPHQYKSSTSQEVLSGLRTFNVVNQKQLNTKNASAIIEYIYYNESLDYLLSYGSYNSILEFFLKYEQFDKCLAFTLENDLEPDLFFYAIYLHCSRNGCIEKLHEAMMNKDSSLVIWKKYLLHVCHSLERRQYLNILYQLQLFMKDSVRAAMTCIRFYHNDINSYTDLCTKANFLLDAQKHLESELHVATFNRGRRKSVTSMHSNQGILTMEMEPSEIDKHINTICRQMEITKFLASCEKEGRLPAQFLNLFPGKDPKNVEVLQVPTLFGNQQQKIDLAVLAILCGRNIEEGFGIAFRIMQDYNLPQQKIYSLAGHVLTMRNNISGIEQLIKCCHTSGIPNSYIISDFVLSHCVKLLIQRLHIDTESILKNDIYNLVRLITDVELKINAYIECKQLKSAYLLAVKHSRTQDIRRILKESERIGQSAIKAICMKWLQQEPKL